MGQTLGRVLSRLFAGPRNIRILMLGLDMAGKTTILYKLKLGEKINTVATIGFNVETVEYKNVSFTVWDVGGQMKISQLRIFYLENTEGLIFVVDSNNRDRIIEARDKLDRLMNEIELREVKLLVLANKHDFPNAMSVTEMSEKLALPSLRQRNWHIQSCCAVTGQGLYEGLDWLSTAISNPK